MGLGTEIVFGCIWLCYCYPFCVGYWNPSLWMIHGTSKQRNRWNVVLRSPLSSMYSHVSGQVSQDSLRMYLFASCIAMFSRWRSDCKAMAWLSSHIAFAKPPQLSFQALNRSWDVESHPNWFGAFGVSNLLWSAATHPHRISLAIQPNTWEFKLWMAGEFFWSVLQSQERHHFMRISSSLRV